MSINLISTPSIIKVGPRKGQTMYTTRVAHYSTIDADAVIDYASEIGLLPRGILRAAWDILGDVIQQLVLHGHIVQIPGVGNIRAEVRAKAQANAADVTPECVTHRKLMLTPNTKLRTALKRTPMTVSVEEAEEEEPIQAPSQKTPSPDPPPLWGGSSYLCGAVGDTSGLGVAPRSLPLKHSLFPSFMHNSAEGFGLIAPRSPPRSYSLCTFFIYNSAEGSALIAPHVSSPEEGRCPIGRRGT